MNLVSNRTIFEKTKCYSIQFIKKLMNKLRRKKPHPIEFQCTANKIYVLLNDNCCVWRCINKNSDLSLGCHSGEHHLTFPVNF